MAERQNACQQHQGHHQSLRWTHRRLLFLTGEMAVIIAGLGAFRKGRSAARGAPFGIKLKLLQRRRGMVRNSQPENAARPATRWLGMSANIAVFAAGCAAAALLNARVGVWCFAVPPLLGLATLAMRSGSENETH